MEWTRQRCQVVPDEDRGDCSVQAQMVVGHDDADPTEPACSQALERRDPKRPVLGVANRQTQVISGSSVVTRK